MKLATEHQATGHMAPGGMTSEHKMQAYAAGRDLSGARAKAAGGLAGATPHGHGAGSLMLNLVAAHTLPDAETGAPPDGIPASAKAILENLIRASIVPGLTLRHLPDQAPGPARALMASPHAEELGRLLVAHDPNAAHNLIATLRQPGRSILPLFAALFEPAARALGDMWRQDICTELDVTIGLSRLQSAIRVLGAQPAGASPLEPFPASGVTPAVLVVPEPGEMHLLGATLDTDALVRAGWAPHSEFPATDKALQDLLHTHWYDALDLSLSAVFNREHWLPRVGETIRRARRASLNPALLVIVGGRVFTERADAGRLVGADAFSTTALQVRQLIQKGLRRDQTHGSNW